MVIALVVRTRRTFFHSRPGNTLLVSTLALIVLTLAIPYLPFAPALGFMPLPAALVRTVIAITGFYVLAAETTKHWFYRVAD